MVSRKLDEGEPCAREAEDCTKADAGRGFLTGLSTFKARLVVEALVLSSSLDARVVLEAFDIESKILWNFRLDVLKAMGILILKGGVMYLRL